MPERASERSDRTGAARVLRHRMDRAGGLTRRSERLVAGEPVGHDAGPGAGRDLSDVCFLRPVLYPDRRLHDIACHRRTLHDSKVPLGFWLKDAFDLSRNHFDRIVHFAFGLLLAYPIHELLLRTAHVRGFWSYYLPVSATLALSGLFEVIECGWLRRQSRIRRRLSWHARGRLGRAKGHDGGLHRRAHNYSAHVDDTKDPASKTESCCSIVEKCGCRRTLCSAPRLRVEAPRPETFGICPGPRSGTGLARQNSQTHNPLP